MTASLDRTYHEWLRATQVLTAARDEVDTSLEPSLEAALENALMRKTLDLPEAEPDDLFSALSVDDVAAGLRIVGNDDHASQNAAERLAPMLRSALVDLPSAQAPPPELTATELRIGAFSLPRVTPVDRALSEAIRRHGEDLGLRHTLACALRYAAIYARTRHIGPPQAVYDAFYAWGVRNEGFASPFNARLLGKDDAGFYSAFPSTDAALGSRGSFFSADPTRHEGAWSVDPPFLPELMSRVDAIIRRWRALPRPPTVLLIIPASHTPDVPVEETVRLESGTHHYSGLDGELRPLPVDVNIHRIGPLDGWDPEVIREGYLPG